MGWPVAVLRKHQYCCISLTGPDLNTQQEVLFTEHGHQQHEAMVCSPVHTATTGHIAWTSQCRNCVNAHSKHFN